jgi:cell division protein ZapA (FtsZ GTPase activity inhibitor)
VAKSNLRIDILGTSFSITADEDPAYLESLLNHYRINVENAQKLTGLTDPLKIAVVTGLLLCDENQKLLSRKGGVSETKEDQEEARKLAQSIIDRLEDAFGGN